MMKLCSENKCDDCISTLSSNNNFGYDFGNDVDDTILGFDSQNKLFQRIAVVGGGAAGVSFCLHLFEKISAHKERYERAGVCVEVFLFERSNQIGPGLAYARRSEHSAVHRLNVPKAWMSPFSNRKNHFEQWLGKRSDNNGDFALQFIINIPFMG